MLLRISLLILLIGSLACNEADIKSQSTEEKINEGKNELAKEPVNTITACVLSEIAYCPNPQKQLDKYLPGWKVVWHPRALNGNHAFVATDGNTYAVAIRGSLIEISWDAFENWIYQDLNVVTQSDWTYSKDGSARISQGSFRGWDNLNKMVDTVSNKNLADFLLETVKPNTPVVFTGHSLGGNLATVYASYYSALARKAGQSNPDINVITFAAPAAGNEDFAKDFDKQFPKSIRVENTGDIVAKFPCASRVTSLADLYGSLPSASEIMVGYKDVTVSLSTVFKTLSTAMTVLELKNGFSHFEQTNGKGTVIVVKPSGKNITNDVQSWFAEAGYQHGVAQYAKELGAPIVDCN